MIYRGVKYSEAENVTVLRFGSGDIAVMPGTMPKEDGFPAGATVIFKNADKAHEIGEDEPAVVGRTTDDILPEVVMEFERIESLDVVIERLQKAREQFANLLTPA